MKDNQDLIATIDLGSNSFRLMICKNDNGQLLIVDSIKDMVSFASGLDNKNNISKEAQQKALKTLKIFGERINGFDTNKVRIVATNTFRVANNIEPFIKKAEKVLGFPIEIISGKEEARLIYGGVFHTIPFNNKKVLIVDIGGGSTEFTIGNKITPIITESIAIGCVKYSTNFFPNGDITLKKFNLAVNTATLKIKDISENLKKTQWDISIGTSGTARTIREILTEYFDDDEITLVNMEFIANLIINAENMNNIKISGLKPERKKVIIGGLVIMIAIFKELKIKSMRVCDAGLRNGVIYELIGKKHNHDLREDTINSFQKRYGVKNSYSDEIQNLVIYFLENMKYKNITEIKPYISWATKLRKIGLSLTFASYQKHSAYIIEYADMPGFSETEQKTIAELVLVHRGSLNKINKIIKTKLIKIEVILALRIANIFYQSEKDNILPEILKLSKNNDKSYSLTISKKWLSNNQLIESALLMEAQKWKNIQYNFLIIKK